MQLTQADVFALTQQLGAGGNNIIYNVVFVDYFRGSHNAALVFSQLLYWTPRAKLAGGWIAKSLEDWHEETRLSPFQIRKVSELFKELDIVEMDLRKFNGFPTWHYRINSEVFTSSFIKFLHNGLSTNFTDLDNQETSQSKVKKVNKAYTDTTKTDTTTETTFTSEPATAARAAKKVAPKKKPAEVPIHSQAKSLFFEMSEKLCGGAPAKWDGREQKALSNTLKNIRQRIAPKMQLEPDNWQPVLDLFAAILQSWGSLDKWYSDKFDITILDSQLNKIFIQLQHQLTKRKEHDYASIVF